VRSPSADDPLARPHVRRTEGDLLADGGREHLRIRVLEDDPDAAANAAVQLLVLEAVFGDLGSERMERPRRGEDETVEQLQQRRLAAAVGAEQRQALAAAYRRGDPVERRLATPERITGP